MMLDFFMPMIPPTATAQEHKINKKTGCFYDPPEVKAMKAKLTAHLAQHRPERPLEGALLLIVTWSWPAIEFTKTGSIRKHDDGALKITPPDTDNLQKGLKDCMTKLGFWKDDAQVAVETIAKAYADKPGITIIVDEMEDEYGKKTEKKTEKEGEAI